MTSVEEAKGTFADFLDVFFQWVSAALHPIENCRTLLSIAGERERFKQISRLWLASFIVTLVVNLPVYHLLGIEWDTVGFHLVNLLCVTCALMASAFAIQIGLRIYGIRAPFADVAAMWTAFVACFQPIAAALSYVTALKMYTTFAVARRQGEGFAQALAAWFSVGSTAMTGPLGIWFMVCNWIGLAGVCVCATLMAMTISETYSIPRQKAFSAMAFGWVILLFPISMAPGFFSTYVVYVFSH